MDRRAAATFLLLLVAIAPRDAAAVYTIPAIDLPPSVPDSVRDTTARSLAAGRDALGWAVHPFRGEFHGLGSDTRVSDLSANGRVVVGTNLDYSGDRAFIWSPATGAVEYEMPPIGYRGDTRPTAISSDGAFVATDAIERYSDSAFRWSLAGTKAIPASSFEHTRVSAISKTGDVLVGTSAEDYSHPGRHSVYGDDPYFISDLEDDDPVPVPPPLAAAYRYRSSTGAIETIRSPDHASSLGVDVTADGETVLFNGTDSPDFADFLPPRSGEAYLWSATAGVRALGHLDRGPGPSASVTQATAISQDGSTVVGVHTFHGGFEYGLGRDDDALAWLGGVTESPGILDADGDGVTGESDLSVMRQQAVIWREASGWSSLGTLAGTADERTLYTYAPVMSGDGEIVVGGAALARRRQSFSGNDLTYDYAVFVWDERRGMRKLRDVLALDYGLDTSGWDLSVATGISDDGTTVIGNGYNPTRQQEAWRAVLARNTPEGDFDFDGDVDWLDLDTLEANLGATADDGAIFYADGDLNADGRIDQADHAAFLGVFDQRLPGDYNSDGRVDAADYVARRTAIAGLPLPTGPADLAAWRADYGATVAAILGLIPEPSTLLSVLAAVSVAAVGRRGAGLRPAR